MFRILISIFTISSSLAGELRSLKDLGPSLEFVNGTTVAVTRPGEGKVELPEFSCEGYNCMHRTVKRAVCTHDPAALDASLNIMWSCEEELDKTKPKTGHPSSLLVFSPTKLICDSNVSAVRGLPWVPLDTFDVVYPGLATEDVMPDQIFVDPDTCVLIYKIENLGAPDEHFSLILVVSFAMLFAIIAICPANCCPRGSEMPSLDPAVLPASLQRAGQGVSHQPPVRRRNVNGPRAVGNTVSHSNVNLQQDTFPIDSVW